MNRTYLFLPAAMLALCSVSVPAFAQGAAQTVALMSVDPATIATGYRTSKVVGSAVLDEKGDKVGTIDDLIITPAAQVPYAILSVGGFLGMGEKHVVVLTSALEVLKGKIVLKGATKETLTALPSYTYTK